MRQITDQYFVSPQIDFADIEAIKQAGITLVIANRPDPEVPPSHYAQAIGAAVRDAGMAFEELPITHQTLTPDNIAAQSALIEGAEGAVLAYCASGTRSTIIWALGQAGKTPSDEIIANAAKGGYDLAGLKPTLEALASGAS